MGPSDASEAPSGQYHQHQYHSSFSLSNPIITFTDSHIRTIKKYWIINKAYEMLVAYPEPSNLSYWWSFGVLSGFFWAIQVVTGFVLAGFYCPDVTAAFTSIDHVMRDVSYGWLVRFLHANGASFFFAATYVHRFRALYFGSYARQREAVWIIGVILRFIMMATAFSGYVLPWGQMSGWAATVITNFFSAVPTFGPDLLTLIWGSHSVDNPLLVRLFAVHFTLGLLIGALIILHIILLHEGRSWNPLRLCPDMDFLTFYPYYIYKDLFAIMIAIGIFGYFVMLNPNLLGHPDNFVQYTHETTPSTIVPEWYFRPYYTILRSFADKLAGVLLMFGAILGLFFIPLTRKVINESASNGRIWTVFYFSSTCLLLIYFGSLPAVSPYEYLGKLVSFEFFLFVGGIDLKLAPILQKFIREIEPKE